MKYPGLVNTFSHRIALRNYILARASKPLNQNNEPEPIPEFIYEYLEKLLDPFGSTNDNLGVSLSISSDGKYIVGGANGDDDKGSNAGSLSVFKLEEI